MQVFLNKPVVVWSAIAAILVSGCGTRKELKPSGQPRTSYEEMAAPAGVSHYTLKPGETAVGPVLDKQISPVYPPSLARPGAAPVTVVVQLVMDENGRVKGVRPQSDTAKGPAGALFDAAVEHAAMQWAFTPLRMQHPRSDGTYQVTQRPFSLWYVFDFKMVDGKPVVESGKR